MAKVPRVNLGDRPSAVVGGGLPSIQGGAAPFAAAASNVAETGYKITADAEKQEAEKLRKVLEAHQAVYNESEANVQIGDYEVDLTNQVTEGQKAFANEPEKLPDHVLTAGRLMLDRRVEAAANSQQALDIAQHGNATLMSEWRKANAWVLERKTQKIKGNLEQEKNILAVNAGKTGSQQGLDIFLAQNKARLFPQYEMVFGKDAQKEWQDTETRAAESYANVQGDKNPVYVMQELENPKGALARALKPGERQSLLSRARTALEKRGRTREYDILSNAAGKNVRAVELLNAGEYSPEISISLRAENEQAIKTTRLDTSFTPMQREKHIELLKQQGEVIDAMDSIQARSQEYDPIKMAVADAAAFKDVDKALTKFKGKKEQLPLLVEQMKRLTLMHKSGEISKAGYAAAFGHVGLAYQKALSDEASNDGFWIFQDSRESGNREMNRLLETRAPNVSEEQKGLAWVAYMQRYVEASKKGDVQKDAARRMARNAISTETGIDVRIKGD